MHSPAPISALHRLHFVEKWSLRKIARHMRIGRRTIAKYLEAPAAKAAHRDRASKLDPFKEIIAELLQQDPDANAPVIAQRLKPHGYDGGFTIVKDYLRTLRKNTVARRAYVGVEPAPGDRFDVDWGHFGALVYNGATRKLYAFCLVESHSRKMYLEFTHSQTFETFARCHIHAFQFFSGTSREIWFDNLATAVAEHDGNLIRFNPRFLAFARECGFIPRACHVAAAWEKGKVERAIGYVRQNFWPLRSFTDLADVNARPASGCTKSPTNAVIAKPGKRPTNASSLNLSGNCPPCFPTAAMPPRRLCIKICVSPSTVTATACPLAMWATNSPSKGTLPPSPSTISIMRSSVMPAAGSADRPSVRSALRKNSTRKWPPPTVRRRNSASSPCWVRPPRNISSASPTRLARYRARYANSSCWSGSTAPKRYRPRLPKRTPHAPSAPITSPTSSASSNNGARCNRRFGSKIRR